MTLFLDFFGCFGFSIYLSYSYYCYLKKTLTFFFGSFFITIDVVFKIDCALNFGFFYFISGSSTIESDPRPKFYLSY